MADLLDLGVEWVRLGFKDSAGFGIYDPAVNAYRAAGIKTLMILHYETEPGMPDKDAPDSEWDAYIAGFAARCRDIAAHYGPNIDAYQIWNEQDHPGEEGYEPGITAAVYGRMLSAVVPQIRSVSAATIVGGGSSAGSASHYQDTRNHLGGTLPLDAIAVHPYGRRPENDWPSPTWFFGPIVDLIQHYKALLNMKVWITEMGVKEVDIDNDRDKQAEFLTRTFAALDGQAEVLHWFCYSDGMVPTFGLLDDESSEKPAYQAFKSLPPMVEPPPTSDWPKLRFFSEAEFKRPEKMDHNILIFMDRSREGYGGRLYVTSSHRTPEENAAVGGHPDSLHMKGQAIDVIPLDETFDQGFMFKINRAIMREWEAIKQPGWSLELEFNDLAGKRHVHVGIAYDGRPDRLIPRG